LFRVLVISGRRVTLGALFSNVHRPIFSR
jgi:hypothetical protein